MAAAPPFGAWPRLEPWSGGNMVITARGLSFPQPSATTSSTAKTTPALIFKMVAVFLQCLPQFRDMVGTAGFHFYLHSRRAQCYVALIAFMIDRMDVGAPAADQRQDSAQFAGAVGQLHAEAPQAAAFDQPVADHAVKQIDVDIAAADHDHHPFATQRRPQLKRSSQRRGTRTFGQQLHPFQQQQDRFAYREIVYADNLAQVPVQ